MNWINVKDKLPENNQIVIVWSKEDNKWFEVIFINNSFSFGDDSINNDFTIEEVSHWMIPTKPE